MSDGFAMRVVAAWVHFCKDDYKHGAGMLMLYGHGQEAEGGGYTVWATMPATEHAGESYQLRHNATYATDAEAIAAVPRALADAFANYRTVELRREGAPLGEFLQRVALASAPFGEYLQRTALARRGRARFHLSTGVVGHG